MPMNKANYPADWKQISLRIREREQNKCKWCSVKNGIWIVRWSDKDGEGYTEYTHAEDMKDGSWQAWNEDEDGPCSEIDEYIPSMGDGKPIKIVLTVAHINHDTSDNSDDNLAALCQRCHLRHDAQHHAENAARTRRARKVEAGQAEMAI
jgi:hypothetical protein